jgi:hypothetical protein
MDAEKDGRSTMKYDDAALERALESLPLEDTPVDLHSRIIAAVAQRPQPAFRPWELWVVGIAFAICMWFVVAIIGAPSEAIRVATQHVTSAIVMMVTPPAVYWLLLGVVTAIVVQARRVPRPQIRAY